MIIQNESATPCDVQDSSFNLKSKEIHTVTASQILPMTQDCENETGLAENQDKFNSTDTRKRKKTQRSSSSMLASKSTRRLGTKRIRL